jgi:glycerol-3-phosphate dehydrogenase
MIISRNFRLLKEHYDTVIIGGGITGLSVARESAARGLKTLLLEKNDFGWFTSAATTKLIHGGLRYLENLEFGLVRESLKERRIMGQSAPHLIRPLPIILPIYDYSRPGGFMLSIGLTLYNLLSYDRNRSVPEELRIPAAHRISKRDILHFAPCLRDEGLKGGFVFYDYQSLRPERLALSFLKSAVHGGCAAFNHTVVENFIVNDSSERRAITGLHVTDLLTGKKYTVTGRVFINCTGPYLDLLLEKLQKNPDARLQRSQGLHLLTEPVCGGYAVLHRNREGRHFFVLPYMGASLIGPTDTPYGGLPDDLFPLYDDALNLLKDVNDFLSHPIGESEVRSVLAGIRPLVSSGKSTYRTSRKSEIYDHTESGIDGLYSVAGGKWTTSRALGESVMKQVIRHHFAHAPLSRFRSDREPLYGSPGFAVSSEDYILNSLKERAIPGIDVGTHRHLIDLYGTEHTEILKMILKNPSLGKKLDPISGDLIAQIHFAVQNESACTLSDVLNRRLAIGTTGVPSDASIRMAAGVMAELLGWDRDRKGSEIRDFRHAETSMKNIRFRSGIEG